MPFEPTRDRVKPDEIDTTPKRRPAWIRVRAPMGEKYEELKTLFEVPLVVLPRSQASRVRPYAASCSVSCGLARPALAVVIGTA